MRSLTRSHRLLTAVRGLIIKHRFLGCILGLLLGHVNIVFVVIDCRVNRPLEYCHIRVGSLRSLNFWGLSSAQDSYNGNLLMRSVFLILLGRINREFCDFLPRISIFFLFWLLLITLVLWLKTSLNNLGGYVLLDLAVEALSERERPHDPASTPRPAPTLGSTPGPIEPSWGYFFRLLSSRSLVDVFLCRLLLS